MTPEILPLKITDEQAEKLVAIIRRGSVRNAVLVIKSLPASLAYRRKLKEEKSLENYLGI